MKRLLKRLALCWVAVLGLSVSAFGSTITITDTLDLTKPQGVPGIWYDSPAFQSPFTTFPLAVGDTLDLRINFLAGQSLTVTDLFNLWAFTLAEDGKSLDFSGTGTISLLDANGVAILTSNARTDIGGEAHFGMSFFASDFTSVPPTITFYGVESIGTVNGYLDPVTLAVLPDVLTRDYIVPGFSVSTMADGSVTINSSVPEPSSLALLGLGGIGIAFGAYRRRRTAV